MYVGRIIKIWEKLSAKAKYTICLIFEEKKKYNIKYYTIHYILPIWLPVIIYFLFSKYLIKGICYKDIPNIETTVIVLVSKQEPNKSFWVLITGSVATEGA